MAGQVIILEGRFPVLAIAEAMTNAGYSTANSSGYAWFPDPIDEEVGVLVENTRKSKSVLAKLFFRNHRDRLFLGVLRYTNQDVWTFVYSGLQYDKLAYDFAQMIAEKFEMVVKILNTKSSAEWETYNDESCSV